MRSRALAPMLADGAPRATRWGLYAVGGAPWSRALYPWLNRGRQLLLRLLGRELIP